MKLTTEMMIQLFDKRPKRLGEALVDQGLLSEEDLDTALVYQRAQPGKRIGTILRELGLVDTLDFMEALSTNLSVVKSYSEG